MGREGGRERGEKETKEGKSMMESMLLIGTGQDGEGEGCK